MCNTGMRIENLVQIRLLLLNQLLQLSHLADLLESKDLVLLVTIYSQTCRIIATVLESRQAIDEGVEDKFPVLLDEVVDVAKNATVRKCLAKLF